MLSKISIALNVVLILAVGNLYYQNSNGQTETEASNVEEDTTKPLRIAFLNTDSLNSNYQYIKDLTDDLNQEAEKKQRRLERKTSKMQSEFMQLQRMSSTMTPAQLQNAQQRVVQMEQEIQTIQNEMNESLNEEQMAVQIKLVAHLDSFITAYNQSENYDYILKKFTGSEILWSDSLYDITDTVISLLNQAYLNPNTPDIETSSTP